MCVFISYLQKKECSRKVREEILRKVDEILCDIISSLTSKNHFNLVS